MNDTKVPSTPAPVMGLYEQTLWDGIRQQRMVLQKCSHCGTWRYPPGPACPACLSLEHAWVEPAGSGEILSWVIFRRGYLPAYPPPYNVIAVRLDEGPILVSNLEGPQPEGSWIGRRVQLCYATMPDGAVLPRFRLA